jgi:hypothetical protein
MESLQAWETLEEIRAAAKSLVASAREFMKK